MATAKKATEKKARKAPPENETDAAKFSRLASARTGAALKAMELIGNCAGPGYESTPAQQKKILDLLREKVAYVENMFKTGGAKSAKQSVTI